MKTVSNYMREMGIKACYIKHWTKTTISKNVTADLKICLKENSIQTGQMLSGVQI